MQSTQSLLTQINRMDMEDNFDAMDEGEIEFKHENNVPANIIDPTPTKNLPMIDEVDGKEKLSSTEDPSEETDRRHSDKSQQFEKIPNRWVVSRTMPTILMMMSPLDQQNHMILIPMYKSSIWYS
jgi:hypothetical protein